MKNQILTLLVSTAISAMSPVFAMDLGDDKTKSAHHLSPSAQYKAGCDYLYGDGVPLDFAKAVKCWTVAANRGHADAQDKLGSAYWCGYGVAQDRAKAMDWWVKSISRGGLEARANLGIVYYHGIGGVAQDCSRAVRWWMQAAVKGNLKALFNLGTAYWEGKGVAQDYAKAVELYQIVADKGITEALNKLGQAYFSGCGVDFDWTKSSELSRKCMNQSSIGALDTLGITYLYGDDVVHDHAKALEWYRNVANQGIVEAQLLLGEAYRQGWGGFSQDDAKAVEWYQEAADQGIAEAEYQVGFAYWCGNGVAVDYAKGVKWFQRAADQGIGQAQYYLGHGYWYDYGVAQDRAKATDCWMMAANKGNIDARHVLKHMCPYQVNAPLVKGSLQEVETLRDKVNEMKSRSFAWFFEAHTTDLKDAKKVTSLNQPSMAVKRGEEGECDLSEKYCKLIEHCRNVEKAVETISEALDLMKFSKPGYMINIVRPDEVLMGIVEELDLMKINNQGFITTAMPNQLLKDIIEGQANPKCLSFVDEHLNWGEENVILAQKIKEIDEAFVCIESNLPGIQEKFSSVLNSKEETKPNEKQFISTFKTLIFDNIKQDTAILAEAKSTITKFASKELVGIRNQMFLDENPWFIPKN